MVTATKGHGDAGKRAALHAKLRQIGVVVAYAVGFSLLKEISVSHWNLIAGLRLLCLLVVPYRYWPAMIIGETDGTLKLIFDPETHKLLGVHIIGDRATELIHIGQMVMTTGGSIDVFIDSVFNYPTLAELYKYAAYDGLGRMAKRAATLSAGP